MLIVRKNFVGPTEGEVNFPYSSHRPEAIQLNKVGSK